MFDLLGFYQYLLDLGGQGPFGVTVAFFTTVGWLVLPWLAVRYYLWRHLEFGSEHYLRHQVRWTMLAIDVPRDNEQSIKAVEQIFAAFHGIKSTPNLEEKWLQHKVQLYFSLELISLEGYIQFLIRLPVDFRDLVEAAIFAQYPDAEVTEVRDYMDDVPDNLNKIDSEYDLWGTEFVFTKHEAFPLRTYTEFEDKLAEKFVDPMASLLEVLSRLRQGELIALQFIILPVGDGWQEHVRHQSAKIAGIHQEYEQTAADKVVYGGLSLLEGLGAWFGPASEAEHKTEKEEPPSKVQFLTPGQRSVLEAMEAKAGKLGFETKIRMIYIAHKNVYAKGRGVAAVIGAINQFGAQDRNALRPSDYVTTKANYVLVDQRISQKQAKVINRFKHRSHEGGVKPILLNTEELATIYHFPTIGVRAPLVKKVASKTSEPPVDLPIASSPYFTHPAGAAAEVIPDYDKDEYERRYALKTPGGSVAAPKSAPPSRLPVA